MSLNIPEFQKMRSNSGAMIMFLSSAAFLLLIAGILFYNLLGASFGQTNQNRALNAAALTAANDLGRIVINDPYFGYVGLVDRTPVGTSLTAGDGYPLPVRSINTIIGALRAQEEAIKNVLDPNTQQMLMGYWLDDYNALQTTVTSLNTALTNSMTQGATKPTDAYGNSVDTFTDAQNAYSANAFGTNNFQMTLGWCPNLGTNLKTPYKDSSVSASQMTLSNAYLAFQDITYPFTGYNEHFIFTAMNSVPALVSGAGFATDTSSLTYAVPDVLKVEGDRASSFLGLFSGTAGYTIHGIVYAIPGSAAVQPMNPGSLVLGFPDGQIPELATVQSLISDTGLSATNLSIYTDSTGDYPTATAPASSSALAAPSSLPTYLTSVNTVSAGVGMLIYDWIRRAGPNFDVKAIKNLLSTSITSGGTSPYMVVSTFDSTGSLQMKSLQMENRYTQVSNNQLVAIGANAVESGSTGQVYDALLIDNVRNAGKTNGGIHGGESTFDIRLTANPTYPDTNFTNTPNELTGSVTSAYTQYGWAGQCGAWAFGIFRGVGYEGPFGGDNATPYIYSVFSGLKTTPQTIITQPGKNPGGGAFSTGSGTSTRPTFTTTGLSTEIDFHKVTQMLPASTAGGG